MAFTTADQAIAGVQWPRFYSKSVTPTLVAGRPHSLWYLGGNPGAGSMDSTTSGGVALSSTSALVSGQIPYSDPGAGESRLFRFSGQATQAGCLILCDRLWHGSYQTSTNAAFVVTTTTAQNIHANGTNPLPARDINGTTAGDGVYLAMEVYAATGAGASVISAVYQSSSGSVGGSQTGRASAAIDAYVASSAIGAFYRMGLQAGDIGVRNITSFTSSVSMTSGNIGFVLYRPLAALEVTAANVPNAVDMFTSGFVKIPNGCVPFIVFIPNTTTASNVSGSVVWTQGY